VAAPEDVKIAQFIARSASGEAITTERPAQLETEARRRGLAQQISDDQKSAFADYVLTKVLFFATPRCSVILPYIHFSLVLYSCAFEIAPRSRLAMSAALATDCRRY